MADSNKKKIIRSSTAGAYTRKSAAGAYARKSAAGEYTRKSTAGAHTRKSTAGAYTRESTAGAYTRQQWDFVNASTSEKDYLKKALNVFGAKIFYRGKQERELEKCVFGDEEDVLEELNSELFTEEQDDKKSSNLSSKVHQKKNVSSNFPKRKPVWEDEDDENILVKEMAATLKKSHRSIWKKGGEKYADYLKEKHMKIMGTPKWAEIDKGKQSLDSDDDSDEELLKKTGNFITKSTSLPKGIIDIRKCTNLSEGVQTTGIIRNIEFHPSSKVALVASQKGVVTLYQVDGKINAKIQSVAFENFPIYTAHFTMDGKDIIVGSKEYGYFYYYDMFVGKLVRVPWEKSMDQMNVRRFQMSPDGKIFVIFGTYGNIHVFSAKTKEWIGTLKMNGGVFAINFNKDGSKMYSHGENGKVYVWDMTTRRCIHRFNDEGCIAGTSIAVSPNGQYIATGSDSGVVNVYESSSVLSSANPTPVKMIMNLTTEISSLKFNSTSEILAMASSHKINALKLVHFPSITVFSNFPDMNKNILYPSCLDLSLNSGYLSFGNNAGKAYLYRLRHFGNY